MGKPHALYIAWGFPPSRGSGVYRALATANGLVEAGFEVTVLTCERETFVRNTHADVSLEALVDPSIEVVRIPFDWPVMERDIRRWSRARARDPLAWRERRPVEDVKDFPEVTYGPWRRPLERAADRIHRRHPVDLTIATANPNVTVAAAHELLRRRGVPFVMDQRDAWTLDVFAETESQDPRVVDLERRYVADATEAWFVNEPLREWHARRYPDARERIHTVSNGYDEELAPRPRLEARSAERPLVFGYLGTITRMLPLGTLVEGWAKARRNSPDLASATAELWGYLGFYAGEDNGLAEVVRQGEADGLHYRGPVDKGEVRDLFDRFDALLLVLGSGRYVTSGKVFEYMASALPIVSVHHPDVDAARVLRGYPLWFPADGDDPSSVAAALAAAAEAARTADPELRAACVEHARTYERRRQLAPRLEHLRGLVAGGSR